MSEANGVQHKLRRRRRKAIDLKALGKIGADLKAALEHADANAAALRAQADHAADQAARLRRLVEAMDGPTTVARAAPAPSPSITVEWVCPAGVTQASWDAWLMERKFQGVPFTQRLYEQALAQLRALEAKGHNPDAVVCFSATRQLIALVPPDDLTAYDEN